MKKHAASDIPDTENPEWTDEMFMQSVRLDALPQGLQTKLRKRGRPPKDTPKQAVKLRLDPDVLEVLRATGPGWQTRVNTILRERFAL